MGGLPTGTINGFAVDPTNPKVMYVATRDGVFRTDNAAKAWTPAPGAPKNAAAVAVNPKKPQEVYAATADGKLYRSTDGGSQWGEALKLAGQAQR
ncbi:MAG TPA: hypothetical protein VGT40_15610 [Methylomirabilota bacterium]|nr:hypothetical protein [Methylomirabilota bacterium]